jgi:hypothetical protein
MEPEIPDKPKLQALSVLPERPLQRWPLIKESVTEAGAPVVWLLDGEAMFPDDWPVLDVPYLDTLPPQFRSIRSYKAKPGAFLEDKKKEAVVGLIMALSLLIAVAISRDNPLVALLVFIFVFPGLALGYFWFKGEGHFKDVAEFLTSVAQFGLFIMFLLPALMGIAITGAGIEGHIWSVAVVGLIFTIGALWLDVKLSAYIAGGVATAVRWIAERTPWRIKRHVV